VISNTRPSADGDPGDSIRCKFPRISQVASAT
jgi:hypothetical protein